MFFAMRHEIAENRVRKTAKFPLIPEWQRTPCLKCGGMAKKEDNTRKCVECDFEWCVENGVILYPKKGNSKFGEWGISGDGLLLIIWEKELKE